MIRAEQLALHLLQQHRSAFEQAVIWNQQQGIATAALTHLLLHAAMVADGELSQALIGLMVQKGNMRFGESCLAGAP